MAPVEQAPLCSQRPPVLALYGAATQLDAEGQHGTTRASLVATPRFVFVIPHTATIVPLVMNWLPRQQAVGPSEEQLAGALRGMLSSPRSDIAQVESWLASHLPADQVLELADLRDYKVGTGGMQRGFYYKRRGAFTWEGMDLAPAAAHQLLAYLPTPAEAKAANPEVANRRIETRPTPGARLRGVLLVLGGLAGSGGGLALGLLDARAGFLGFTLGAALVALGLVHLIWAKPIDVRTGQPAGRWLSVATVATVVGAFLGAGLFGLGVLFLELMPASEERSDAPSEERSDVLETQVQRAGWTSAQRTSFERRHPLPRPSILQPWPSTRFAGP